jgi:hypothetical protein
MQKNLEDWRRINVQYCMNVMNEGRYYKISKINNKSDTMPSTTVSNVIEPTVMTEIMHGGRQEHALHVYSSKVTVSVKK